MKKCYHLNVFRSFIIDADAFHPKHQHDLVPTSLVTGVIHLAAEKTRDHVQSRIKKVKVATKSDSESQLEYPYAPQPSSRRPTLLDLSTKIKRSADFGKPDCGCKGKTSIADGIAEHTVDRDFGQKFKAAVTSERELEEHISHNGHFERSKRSSDDSDNRRSPSTSCSSSSCFAFPPRQRQQPQSSICSSGNCDRVDV